MTKAELARIVATTHNVDAATALKLINCFLGLIVKTTASGMPVQLHGFGTFTLDERQPMIRPPRSRRRTPSFRPSKAYQMRIR